MAQKGVSLIKAAFDTDNFLMRFSEKVLDIVTANLLFVVSCLPIVTIGVAKISLTPVGGTTEINGFCVVRACEIYGVEEGASREVVFKI